MRVRISDIIIKRRIRLDIGNLTNLMDSMRKNGLINPVTLNDRMELLAGFRRIEAAKSLGWDDIECNIISARSKLDKLLIEADENIARKSFTADEIMRFQEEKRYLTARGFEKFWLWILRLIRLIKEWLRSIFRD